MAASHINFIVYHEVIAELVEGWTGPKFKSLPHH